MTKQDPQWVFAFLAKNTTPYVRKLKEDIYMATAIAVLTIVSAAATIQYVTVKTIRELVELKDQKKNQNK